MNNKFISHCCIAATIEAESPTPDALVGRRLAAESVCAAQIFLNLSTKVIIKYEAIKQIK